MEISQHDQISQDSSPDKKYRLPTEEIRNEACTMLTADLPAFALTRSGHVNIWLNLQFHTTQFEGKQVAESGAVVHVASVVKIDKRVSG